MTFKGTTKLTQPAAPVDAPVIKHNRRDNCTSGVPPMVIRLTTNERQILQDWLIDLQQHTQKRLTAAKLIRGIIGMREKIKPQQLVEAIVNNT